MEDGQKKRCLRCGREKLRSEFRKNTTKPDGLQNWCAECFSTRYAENSEKHKENSRKWYESNPARRIEARRKADYGISVEEQRSMWEDQSGQCLICSLHLDYNKAHLDHHHDSGQVRGFLCRNCNLAVGGGKDDPKLLRRAAAYVHAFQINPDNAHQALLNLRKAGGF